jgi:hypothetical protein
LAAEVTPAGDTASRNGPVSRNAPVNRNGRAGHDDCAVRLLRGLRVLPLLLAEQGPSYVPPLPGFLQHVIPGARGELMLDVVFVAMFLIVPLLGVSIFLVKFRRRFQLHKWLQVGMGVVLLVAVVAFEIDIRFITDWEKLAEPSRFWSSGDGHNWVWYALSVHLCFAIPTPLIWIFVIVQALRKFPRPPRPNEYSPSHIFWARLAAIEMTLTAVTGWVFYVLAFVL